MKNRSLDIVRGSVLTRQNYGYWFVVCGGCSGMYWKADSVGVGVFNSVRVIIGSLAVLGFLLCCGRVSISAESRVLGDCSCCSSFISC